MNTVRVDAQPVLDQLKDFQRKTVDYVFQRFYLDAEPARRFLVADEVGLGKTLVARGVIAKAIEHLQANTDVERIDVVYICSNADIARQNVNRLNVTGRQEFNLPTRITMLPMHLRQLNDHGINFVSFTPGTSFDLKSRGGMAQERALLYWLLRHAWGWPRKRHEGVFKVLRGGSSMASFRNTVNWIPSEVGTRANQIDPSLAEAFKQHLADQEIQAHGRGEPSLQDRLEALADRYRSTSKDPDWYGRQQLVGDLRHTLARSCVNALEPDLVILDEFQRFRHLLDGNDAAAELAQHLFDQDTARVLLLSATPYKMYTLPEESEAHDDHYADFLRTARFLMGAQQTAEFQRELSDFRHALLDLAGSPPETVRRHRSKVEKRLRRVMSRTERLAVASDRNGMLVERPSPGATLEAGDLRAFLAADLVSRRLGTGDALEYWKSAPYLLNFMESYKLKRTFRDAVADPVVAAELAQMLSAGDGLLSFKDIEAYDKVDAGNARLRALMHDTIDTEAWRLLWLPPSLPYYRPVPPFDGKAAQFTKRLVFSAWWMVPQVISTLVSYEAERRMVRDAHRKRVNTAEARKRIRPLLRIQKTEGRTSGMPLFALMYPSPALATLIDPLQLSKKLGGAVNLPRREEIVAAAERRVKGALRPLLPADTTDGPLDERWYWAAPLLLDAQMEESRANEWIGRFGVHAKWSGEGAQVGGVDPQDVDSAWSEVPEEARSVLREPDSLGRPPDDLVSVVTQFALAAPGTAVLRSLARAAGGLDQAVDWDLRDGAARAAWGFRTLFNIPEVSTMLRPWRSREDAAYWRVVLGYALNGNLQAVLDEYVHVLREWLGILDRDPFVIGRELGGAIHDALSVRAANYRVEDIRAVGGSVEAEHKNIRARFAMRFGAQSPDEGGNLQRASQVRYAFNSPFWPFVLATTSVGQEGLDFHLYCHAVVHWNLPANPVDLEQREGRVHRYKGHAIRKNVAATHREAAYRGRGSDPWEVMFNDAKRSRDRASGDLVPYWVYSTEGGARIERYVPALPLSREIEKLERLKRSLAVYRLVFGQPRQDDLTAYLESLPEQDRQRMADELRVDLTPR